MVLNKQIRYLPVTLHILELLKFNELQLDKRLLEGIRAIGFENATPVQEKAIPEVISGKDVIALAQTGTGKTAAFLLPVIHNILKTASDDHIKALVIVPTRELAVQIDQQMEGLSYYTSLSSIAVYGGGDGASFTREKQALTDGADVIVGTPGRLIAHLIMGYVKVQKLEYLVLDEADRMLDMGFYDDILRIISYLPKKRQNLLFAATMPPKIRDLARKVLHNPIEINIAISKPAEKVLQLAYVVYNNQKIPLVKHLLGSQNAQRVIVFCSTKNSAKELAKELRKSKLKVEDIHSDLDQSTREKVLMAFKNRDLNILVATDILSRGIDVEDIELIINFDVPNDGEDYIHRIGRTARAQAEGIAITLINEKEQYQFQRIEELLEKPVHKGKVPETLGNVPEYKVQQMKKKPFGKRRSYGKPKHKYKGKKH